MDWNFSSTPEKNNRISTGPTFGIQLDSFVKWDMNTRQGVCLLPRPITRDADTEQIGIVCETEYKDTAINFKFNIKYMEQ